MNYEFSIEGLKELQDNIRRNPQVVKDEVNKFLVRATAGYRSIIQNNPWRVGQGGGGVPVRTGNLRDTHQTVISTWEAYIQPTASYAKYVHAKRPWLEYAFEKGEDNTNKLEEEMMKSILANLAK